MPASLRERDRPRRGTSTTASGRDACVDGLDPLAVVAQRDDEVVEVVLEVGFDDAGLERDDADAAPVRVGVEVEIGPG